MAKNKLYVLSVIIITICIIFSGCAAQGDNAYSGEQTELAVDRVYDAIKEAYGEDYLPDTKMEESMLQSEFSLNLEEVDAYKAEMPAIGVHPDRLLVVKAKEGKGENVEAQLKKARQSKIEDTMVYPVYVAKVNASKVVRRGDYVVFILLGAINDNMDMTDKQAAEFATAQVQRGVDAFEDMFR